MAQNFCTDCGQALTPGSRFCGMCGYAVGVAEVTRPVAEQPPTVIEWAGSAKPFEELSADMTPELSDLIQGILTAREEPATMSRLIAEAIELDPINANRMIAITLTSLAELQGEDSSELLCALGMDAHRYGDEEGAQSMLEYAARSGSTDAMGCLAAIAQGNGDNSQALIWWQRAADLGDARAMYWSSKMIRSQGDVVRADSLLERALAAGDIYAQNDVGRSLLDGPRRDEGLALIETSARAGVPWAAANFTWHFLQTGEYARAVALFDEVEPAAVKFVEESGEDPVRGGSAVQLANARSNAALCRLALTGDTSTAVRVWNGGLASGHAESAFYPLLVLWSDGYRLEATAGYRALAAEVRAEIPVTMEELAHLPGWAGEWARLGQSFIADATH